MNKLSPIVRWPEVLDVIGFKISRSTLERWERAGKFPKRIQLGKNSVGWSSESINKWIKEKIKESKTK